MAIKSYGDWKSPPPVHEEFLTVIVDVNWSDKGQISFRFILGGGLTNFHPGNIDCSPVMAVPTAAIISGYVSGINYSVVESPVFNPAGITASATPFTFPPWTTFNVGRYKQFVQTSKAKSAPFTIEGWTADGSPECYGPAIGYPFGTFGALQVSTGFVPMGTGTVSLNAPDSYVHAGRRYTFVEAFFEAGPATPLTAAARYKDSGSA